MPDDAPTTLQAALAAHDAGLCIVRVATDGTKRPLGAWKQWQAERPSREQVEAWFSDGHPGMGVICGAVSGDLEMLELEGRFMAESAEAFVAAIADAGLELLFRRLTAGYHTVSPSGGRHFLYRVHGAIEGNTKLARRPSTDDELADNADDLVKTLIETRGEGGFVVLAPSHGPVHPTGKAWRVKHGTFADIPTISAEEREALFDVCRTFDTAPTTQPPPPPPAKRTTVARASVNVGESWMDAVVDHLEHSIGVRGALERHGWVHCYDDRHGRQLMRRPGKDQGVSGSINTNGRLHPFSTSTPFECGRTTYDTLDVLAVYEFGGDRQAAARAIAEESGILEDWKRTQDAKIVVEVPPGVDPETGEITPTSDANLPDEFWTQRPILEHIRQAAHSRLVSADALLVATLARVSLLMPPNLVLPAIVGDVASLNLFVAIVDPSGGGKTAAANVARRLVVHQREDFIDPILPSSGEGLIEAFFEWVDEEQPDGKNKKMKRQTKTAGFAFVDEGQSLLAQAERSGSTIMETIRSAWVGGDIGQHNAAEERKRWLKPHQYRLSIVMGFQLAYAASLIADAEGGTPQRFTFALATDPNITDGVEWPGEIHVDQLPRSGNLVDFSFDTEIAAEIRQRRVQRSRGEVRVDPLDTHADLRKMKLAAALAALDGRYHVRRDDWDIAEAIDENSKAVRMRAVEYNRLAQDLARKAAVIAAVEREAAIEVSTFNRALDRVARNFARRVWRDGPLTPKAAFRSVSSRDRNIVDVDDVVAVCVDRKWVSIDGEMVTAGEVRP